MSVVDSTTRALLYALILLGVVGFMALRAWRKNRNDYRDFARLRSSVKRQRKYRRWFFDSLLVNGGLAVAVLLLVWPYVEPVREQAQRWTAIQWLDEALLQAPLAWPGILLWALLLALVLLLFVPLFFVRGLKPQELVTIGNIGALLPRNRPELGYGVALSVNAGVVEELLFRLALPALIFAASGDALLAWAGSLLLFGAMHAYQGLSGVISTVVIGAAFTLLYLLSGSIGLVILAHILFDLRSLVLIPMVAFGAHRINPAGAKGSDGGGAAGANPV